MPLRPGPTGEAISANIGPFDVLVTAAPAAAGQDVQAYFAGMLQDLGV